MKKKVKEAVVGVAAGIALSVMGGSFIGTGNVQVQPDQNTVCLKSGDSVGRIIPVNLRSGPAKFSSVATQQDCCGPQSSSCPSYVCANQ